MCTTEYLPDNEIQLGLFTVHQLNHHSMSSSMPSSLSSSSPTPPSPGILNLFGQTYMQWWTLVLHLLSTFFIAESLLLNMCLCLVLPPLPTVDHILPSPYQWYSLLPHVLPCHGALTAVLGIPPPAIVPWAGPARSRAVHRL